MMIQLTLMATIYLGVTFALTGQPFNHDRDIKDVVYRTRVTISAN